MLQVIYTLKFMNLYSSYQQIFNQNEGLHDKENNGKVIGYKIATLEGVIINRNCEGSYRPLQLSNFMQDYRSNHEQKAFYFSGLKFTFCVQTVN